MNLNSNTRFFLQIIDISFSIDSVDREVLIDCYFQLHQMQEEKLQLQAAPALFNKWTVGSCVVWW